MPGQSLGDLTAGPAALGLQKQEQQDPPWGLWCSLDLPVLPPASGLQRVTVC